MEGLAIADDLKAGWVADVLKFWFEQTEPDQWFEKDPTFDASIRERFLGLHETLVSRGNNDLLTDAQTALAAVIVLDQMSRNMFRHSPPEVATRTTQTSQLSDDRLRQISESGGPQRGYNTIKGAAGFLIQVNVLFG